VADFAEGEVYLFPADGEVGASFGEGGAWTLLCEDKPRDTENKPIWMFKRI
jgi:hypothetical protein